MDVAGIAVVSGGYALGAAVLLWLLTTPLRRRSLRAALLVQGILCLAATLAGVLGTARAMFLSRHDLYVTTVVALVVAVIVTGAALLLSRQISREHGSLRDAAARLGAGGDPGAGPDRPLAAELEQVRHSLLDAGRALTEARGRERAMVAAQREMFVAMSHDLRTPMAGIRAMAEALEDGVAPDPAAYHARIRADVDRLASMVEALFDLARPDPAGIGGTDRTESDAGRGRTAAAAAVPLSDIVSDCLAGLDALARSRGIALGGRADGEVELRGDPSAISRAVANLLTNALAATPPGGSVQAVLERIEAPAPTARLTVTDSCGGIDAGDLARVFDVGFRGSRPADIARAAPGGAGLGLAVTRRIAQAHGGTVAVANTARGCAFVLDLPLDGGVGTGADAGADADAGTPDLAGAAATAGAGNAAAGRVRSVHDTPPAGSLASPS